MRQHSKTPTLFDGDLVVLGLHRPYPCDQGMQGGCLQLLGGQPHQFSYQFRWFLGTFSRVQSHNLIAVVAAAAAAAATAAQPLERGQMEK